MIDEHEYEARMREALRPIEAPRGLEDRILAKATARKRPSPILQWAAIAAALLIGAFGLMAWRSHQVEKQFRLAMNITSRKLTHIQHKLVIEIPLPHRSERQNNNEH